MSNTVEPSRMAPRGRAPGGPGRWLMPLLFGGSVVVLLVLAIPFFQAGAADDGRDADLCPLDPAAVGMRAVLLLDLRKPMDATPGLPADMLRRVARSVAADTELRVFAIADDPMAPRVPLGRVCKPYANDELAAPAAKDRSGPRDCDDLPAQLPTRLRERAQLYCDRRAAIEQEIDALVTKPPPLPLANAYLVEAIDDTRLELAEAGGAVALHVLSDMLQHAPWYSHLEREPDNWGAEAFAEARRGRAGILDEPPPASALAVRVYYIPRSGTTEHPRVARAHKRFWRGYFGGADVAFDDLPVLGAYDHELLTAPADEPADAPPPESPAESDEARAERDQAERLLELVQAERAALEQAREEAAAEARELEVRAAELSRREEALARTDDANRPVAPMEDAAPATATPPIPDAETANAEAAVDAQATPAADAAPPNVVAAAPTEPEPASPPPLDACPAVLRPGVTAAADAYPNGGWTNYGSADIAVAYIVDDYGETIDSEVSASEADSSSDLPRFMPLFVTAAEDLVRSWVFDFTATESCLRRQQRVTVLRFRYRR